MIDSHVHFWEYHPLKDVWIDDSMKVIQRDFLPQDLITELQQNNVSGCVAVQADQSLVETDFLLDLARQHTFIKGVVGWIDLKSNTLEAQLDAYQQNTKLKGWRHIVQAEADTYMDNANFRRGISLLEKYSYTYDILIHRGQIQEAIQLVKDFPNQKFVIDHLAKPDIKNHELEPWTKQIKALASLPNVSCKISGMVTEADWHNWSYKDLRPYLDVVFDCFGTHRLMYGSDWPVCILASSYTLVKSVLENYIKELSSAEKEQITKINTKNFYQL